MRHSRRARRGFDVVYLHVIRIARSGTVYIDGRHAPCPRITATGWRALHGLPQSAPSDLPAPDRTDAGNDQRSRLRCCASSRHRARGYHRPWAPFRRRRGVAAPIFSADARCDRPTVCVLAARSDRCGREKRMSKAVIAAQRNQRPRGSRPCRQWCIPCERQARIAQATRRAALRTFRRGSRAQN